MFLQVVFGTGKSPDQLAASLQSIATRQRVVLATRIEPNMYAAVRKFVQGKHGILLCRRFRCIMQATS